MIPVAQASDQAVEGAKLFCPSIDDVLRFALVFKKVGKYDKKRRTPRLSYAFFYLIRNSYTMRSRSCQDYKLLRK